MFLITWYMFLVHLHKQRLLADAKAEQKALESGSRSLHQFCKREPVQVTAFGLFLKPVGKWKCREALNVFLPYFTSYTAVFLQSFIQLQVTVPSSSDSDADISSVNIELERVFSRNKARDWGSPFSVKRVSSHITGEHRAEQHRRKQDHEGKNLDQKFKPTPPAISDFQAWLSSSAGPGLAHGTATAYASSVNKLLFFTDPQSCSLENILQRRTILAYVDALKACKVGL